MIKDFIFELFKFIGELNYWHVGILSALESTAFPVIIPVETVIIPMGYYAYLGTKNLPLLMFSCTTGIVVGCLMNYWFARALGRSFIYKHSKFLHINVDKLQKLELRFLKHSRLLMFVGRFVPIPAFKHIITIPAGLAKMPLIPFTFYNALGGFIFSTSMLLIGYFFGSSEELIHMAIGKFTVACIVVALMYIVVKIIINIVIKRRESYIFKTQQKKKITNTAKVKFNNFNQFMINSCKKIIKNRNNFEKRKKIKNFFKKKFSKKK